jgi:hypothetical protein
VDEYIREFVPGEFGKLELPDVPDGFYYATHVRVTLRMDGEPIGRLRRLMTLCDVGERAVNLRADGSTLRGRGRGLDSGESALERRCAGWGGSGGVASMPGRRPAWCASDTRAAPSIR